MSTKDRDLIGKAKEYLSLIPDVIRKEPNDMIQMIEALLSQLEHNEKQLKLYKGVVDAANNLSKQWEEYHFEDGAKGASDIDDFHSLDEALSQLPKGSE